MSFIPYQIDYTVTGKGKTLGISKKRIVFKFGFANRDALSERLTGAACRGSEHEVVLILSLASGKRHVLLDGREVHFSQGEKMNRTFDFPFTVRVPGVGSVHARLITDTQPGAKPHNFFINGMSYFHFSKIYELGTPAMRVGQLTEQRGYGAFTSNSELEAPPEERRLIAQAKLESMRELREREERERQEREAPKQMNREEGNLINFDDDVVGEGPPPAVPAQGMMYQASSLTLDPSFQQQQSPPSYTQNAPAPSGQAYQNYSLNTSQTTTSAPPPQQQYGYGAPPTASATTSQYSQQPPPGGPTTSMITQYSQGSYAPSPYAQAPTPQASFSSQSTMPQQSYGYPQQQSYPTQSAPAPTYEETQMAFGSPAPAAQQQQPDFASPQSYGSAPAFAQPPHRSASGSSGGPHQQQPGGNYGYPSGSGW